MHIDFLPVQEWFVGNTARLMVQGLVFPLARSARDVIQFVMAARGEVGIRARLLINLGFVGIASRRRRGIKGLGSIEK